jgi:hypothetical protein
MAFLQALEFAWKNSKLQHGLVVGLGAKINDVSRLTVSNILKRERESVEEECRIGAILLQQKKSVEGSQKITANSLQT